TITFPFLTPAVKEPYLLLPWRPRFACRFCGLDCRSLLSVRRQEKVDGQQSRADADRRIGNIEHWPMVVPIINLDEIDYTAHPHRINEVAADPAGEQGERYIEEGIGAGAPQQIIYDDKDCADRYSHQQPFDVAVVQHAESNAPVFSVAEIQQAPDND